ncbi:MAG: UDP-N-acetylglucosamine 2-epimerase (non-hydrolyzing) [Clostridia bacterium]
MAGKIKGLLVFGTRPEAIKMCPLVKELKTRDWIETRVCVTGQHKEMLQQVLDIFGIVADYNLLIMKPEQTLFDVTVSTLNRIKVTLEGYLPDIVFVHGDTTTAFTTSLACYYLQIPIVHIEAGLRTYNMLSPFPEEYNRQSIGLVARYHFAPTAQARNNLIKEGKNSNHIFVTGNTGIDALKATVREDYRHKYLDWANGSRLLMVTAHRRENLGEPMHGMFRAIRRIVEDYPDIKVIYPVHMNPAVYDIANSELSGCNRIKLIKPLNAFDFHNFMYRSYFILTDSGGIQEEAPFLGKPVLVMRDTTERPEGIAAGTLKLVGTDEQSIYDACKLLLEDKNEYNRMASAQNPYGDGNASIMIADILEHELLHS